MLQEGTGVMVNVGDELAFELCNHFGLELIGEILENDISTDTCTVLVHFPLFSCPFTIPSRLVYNGGGEYNVLFEDLMRFRRSLKELVSQEISSHRRPLIVHKVSMKFKNSSQRALCTVYSNNENDILISTTLPQSCLIGNNYLWIDTLSYPMLSLPWKNPSSVLRNYLIMEDGFVKFRDGDINSQSSDPLSKINQYLEPFRPCSKHQIPFLISFKYSKTRLKIVLQLNPPYISTTRNYLFIISSSHLQQSFPSFNLPHILSAVHPSSNLINIAFKILGSNLEIVKGVPSFLLPRFSVRFFPINLIQKPYLFNSYHKTNVNIQNCIKSAIKFSSKTNTNWIRRKMRIDCFKFRQLNQMGSLMISQTNNNISFSIYLQASNQFFHSDIPLDWMSNYFKSSIPPVCWLSDDQFVFHFIIIASFFVSCPSSPSLLSMKSHHPVLFHPMYTIPFATNSPRPFQLVDAGYEFQIWLIIEENITLKLSIPQESWCSTGFGSLDSLTVVEREHVGIWLALSYQEMFLPQKIKSIVSSSQQSNDLKKVLEERLINNQTIDPFFFKHMESLAREGLIIFSYHDLGTKIRVTARKTNARMVGEVILSFKELETDLNFDISSDIHPQVLAYHHPSFFQSLMTGYILERIGFKISRSNRFVEKRRDWSDSHSVPELVKLTPLEIAKSISNVKQIYIAPLPEKPERAADVVQSRSMAMRLFKEILDDQNEEEQERLERERRRNLKFHEVMMEAVEAASYCGCCGDVKKGHGHGKVCSHKFRECSMCKFEDKGHQPKNHIVKKLPPLIMSSINEEKKEVDMFEECRDDFDRSSKEENFKNSLEEEEERYWCDVCGNKIEGRVISCNNCETDLCIECYQLYPKLPQAIKNTIGHESDHETSILLFN